MMELTSFALEREMLVGYYSVPMSEDLAALRLQLAEAEARAKAAEAEAARAQAEAAKAALELAASKAGASAHAAPQSATSPSPEEQPAETAEPAVMPAEAATGSAEPAEPTASQLSSFVETVRSGYSFDAPSVTVGTVMDEGTPVLGVTARMPLSLFNRHMLVAGATGTGKTRTLQLLAEGLSAAGASVLLCDVKGDLTGSPRPEHRRRSCWPAPPPTVRPGKGHRSPSSCSP